MHLRLRSVESVSGRAGIRNLGICLILLTALFPNTINSQMTVADTQDASRRIPLHSMTEVNETEHLGYFGDPYPIHEVPWIAPFLPQSFSGTTSELMSCERPIKPGCFKPADLSVVIPEALRTEANNAGNEFFDQINRNIYQTSNGRWNMAITLYLRKLGAPPTTLAGTWTVVAHAHPSGESLFTVPTGWVVDKILVGSLAEAAKANYDGKYFENEGKLYLIYSKREENTVHDGIVAQAMKSPTEVETSDPVWLLAPSIADDGFNSEYFHINWADGGPNADFKLIETGNITKIAGKYVMAYSTGDYQQRNYKSALAFSDTFIPQEGESYRRLLQIDTEGIWGKPGHLEVRYLLQSQKPMWPNYVGQQVLAPGVPSIVQEPSGKYFLYMDGFSPSDAPPSKNAPKTSFDPTHRRPFYVPLDVNVPYTGSVGAATEGELNSWITVKAQ